MKRVYALLFNLSLISTHSVAKSNKIETKNSHNKNSKTINKKIDKKDNNFQLANYKIEDGDTLFTIARKHHTTISQVELVNKLEKDERLKIGRVLKVPKNTYKPSQKSSSNTKKKSPKSKHLTHTIKAGETLLAIAINNKTSLAELEKINKFSAKSKKLRLGETILIPRSTKKKQSSSTKVAQSKKSPKSKKLTHTIKRGDTLLALAIENQTTVAKIEELNKFSAKSKKLKLGEVILIPKTTQEKKPSTTKVVKIQKKSNSLNKSKKIAQSKKITHTIKKGDTLLALAVKNHTTVAKIEKLNKFSAKNKKLKLGETILIPRNIKEQELSPTKVAKVQKKSSSVKKSKKVAQNKKKSFHIIKKGDTLYKVATQNNTTVAKIKKMNKIAKSTNLKLGQKILLVENKAVSKKSKKKNLLLAKKSLKTEKKSSKTKIAKTKTTKIRNKKKIAAVSDRTTRFTKRTVKSQAKSEQKSIFDLLGLGGSSLKLSTAKKHLGKRYVWGAVGPKTFDCSGFTKYVCDKNGIGLPRTSIKQSKVGKKVGINDLKAGDLIFFDTSRRRKGYVNHVGIYIGNNKFIHASSAKRKVVITSLKRPFYKSRFKWGSRIKG